MKTDFDVYDEELLIILIKRISKFSEKKLYSPIDIQPWIDSIDKTWNEYKARFEEYKKEYEEREKKR